MMKYFAGLLLLGFVLTPLTALADCPTYTYTCADFGYLASGVSCSAGTLQFNSGIDENVLDSVPVYDLTAYDNWNITFTVAGSGGGTSVQYDVLGVAGSFTPAGANGTFTDEISSVGATPPAGLTFYNTGGYPNIFGGTISDISVSAVCPTPPVSSNFTDYDSAGVVVLFWYFIEVIFAMLGILIVSMLVYICLKALMAVIRSMI